LAYNIGYTQRREMEDQEFEDFDLNRLAEEILLQKTWAEMGFDDFWAWLRVTTRAQTLVDLMNSDRISGVYPKSATRRCLSPGWRILI